MENREVRNKFDTFEALTNDVVGDRLTTSSTLYHDKDGREHGSLFVHRATGDYRVMAYITYNQDGDLRVNDGAGNELFATKLDKPLDKVEPECYYCDGDCRQGLPVKDKDLASLYQRVFRKR